MTYLGNLEVNGFVAITGFLLASAKIYVHFYYRLWC